MGVMQVIGGANRHIVDTTSLSCPAQLLDMPVEALELGEKIGFGEKAIEDPHRIGAVESGDQNIAGIVDRLQMAGRNVAGGAGEGKITRRGTHLISFEVEG